MFLVLSGIYPGISFFKSIANLETAISEKVLFLLIGLKIDFFFILSNNKGELEECSVVDGKENLEVVVNSVKFCKELEADEWVLQFGYFISDLPG